MPNDIKYNISFTAGALMVNEMCAVAQTLALNNGNWLTTKELALKQNILQKNKLSTNKRIFSLVKQRISNLTESEFQLLINGSAAVKRIIAYLAVCKTHSFIADFVSTNVRECFFNLNEKISHANFNEFFNEKKYIHPELETISDLTISKMRQIVFKILQQMEIIESINSGVLQRPFLPEIVEHAIIDDNPKWLEIFLYSNNEINNSINLYE